MDVYTFLIVLAFFITVLGLVAMVFGQTQLADNAIAALARLSGRLIPRPTQPNSDKETGTSRPQFETSNIKQR